MEIIKCNYRTSFLLAKIGFQKMVQPILLHIAANHDGDLNRAKDLTYKVAEAERMQQNFSTFKQKQ